MTINKNITIEKELSKAATEYTKKHGMKFSTLVSVLLVKYLEENGVKLKKK